MNKSSEAPVSPYTSYCDESAMFVARNREEIASDLAGYAQERREATNTWRKEIRLFRESMRESIQKERQENREFLIECSRKRSAEKEKMQGTLSWYGRVRRDEFKQFQRSVHEDLNQFHSDQIEAGRGLKRGLRDHHMELRAEHQSNSADRERVIRELRNERQKESHILKESLSAFNIQLRRSVHELLLSFQQERKESSLAILGEIRNLHRDLSSERLTLIHETRDMLKASSKEKKQNFTTHQDIHPSAESSGVFGQNPVPDIPLEIMQSESEPEVLSLQHDDQQGIQVQEEDDIESLKDRILEVVAASPSGISLTAIGSQMEIEWRKLIRPARDLLNDGLIRKEEVEYFPKLEETEEQEPDSTEPPGE